MLSLPCLALAASGCPSSSTTSQGSSGGSHTSSSAGHHGSGSSSGASASHGDAGGSSGGSGGAATSASENGSSSGAASSAAPVCGSDEPDAGAPTLFNCQNVGDYGGDAGDCPADWFGTKVLDYASCKPICGAAVQAQSPAGVPIEGTAVLTDPVGGTFHFCLPASTTFETVVTAPGYGTYYYGEIEGQLSANVPVMGLISASTLSAFGSFLPGGLDPTRGAIAVPLNPLDDCDFGPDQKAGYTVTLLRADGGSYPDGGYELLYLDAAGYPESSLTATSALGVTILYDVDTTLGTFPLLQFTSPDGACKVVNEQLGFTGRVQVAPGAFSEEAIFVE